MSSFDNHVCKCERCGDLYTVKETVYPRKFKYHVMQDREENDQADSNHIVMPVSPYNDTGLCPKCLTKLSEWMEAYANLEVETRLKETPLGKAFREFAASVKELNNKR